MYREDLKGDPNCKSCNGTGYLMSYKKSDLYKTEIPIWKRCSCLKRKKVDQHLKDLVEVPDIPESPLYTLMSKNVFIFSEIKCLRQHLKYCFGKAGQTFTFEAVPDNRLLEIQFERDEEFKSLGELKRCDLLVIYLGHVGFTKHDALGGIIMETVSNRLFANKPTWIHTYRPFNSSTVEYTEDLNRLIEEYFEQIKLEKLGVTRTTLDGKKNSGKSPKGSANINDFILNREKKND